jgi:hypothetical protein
LPPGTSGFTPGRPKFGITNHDYDFSPRPVFYALQNTKAIFSDTKFDSTIEVSGADIPALRRKSGFPFLTFGFRSKAGKAVVAYWLAAHSLPGNAFPPLYATLSLKNTGIEHPVLIDVVSGDIKRLQWKAGTNDTLDGLPVTDSILAIADEDYFDWPVLPEVPSSLNAVLAGNSVKLSWQVHGGNPTRILVERRVEQGGQSGSWQRIAELGPAASDYADPVNKGQQLTYRVRTANADGESAYSNILRVMTAAR